MEEVWKAVVGYEGLYEVSSLGRVRSVPRTVHRERVGPLTIKGGVMKPAADDLNRRRVTLTKDGSLKSIFVHRLVLEAFVGPCPEGMECCHNNGDASDNRKDNLRWDTHQANIADKKLHGTSSRGEKNNLAKLTEAQVKEILVRRAAGERGVDLAREYGVTDQTISDITRRRAWGHV